MNELYICGRCEAINLHWGECWNCPNDDLTPKSEIVATYDRVKVLWDKIRDFEYEDEIQGGNLTRRIEEAEKRNWK